MRNTLCCRLLLALLALAAGPLVAFAQDPRHFPPADQVRIGWTPGPAGGRGQVELTTRGLPPGTSITLQVEFDGSDIRPAWIRGYTRPDGSVTLPLGPFGKAMAPGTYSMVVGIDPRQQDPRIIGFFAGWRPLLIRYKWPYKIEEEAAARAAFRREMWELCAGFLAMIEEIERNGDAWRARQLWFDKEGRFERAPFETWARQLVTRWTAAQRRQEALAQRYLEPYYSEAVRFYLCQIVMLVRVAAIDYTIYPIYRHQRIPEPEDMRPITEIMMKPNRVQCILRSRHLARAIQKRLGLLETTPIATLWPEPKALPKGHELPALTAAEARLVPANPGSSRELDGRALKAVFDGWGIRVALTNLEEIGLLVVAKTPDPKPPGAKDPEDPKAPGADPKDPPAPPRVPVYVFRYKDILYAPLLAQRMKRRKMDTQWAGYVLRNNDDLVVIIDADPAARPTRKLVAWLLDQMRKHGFKEE